MNPLSPISLHPLSPLSRRLVTRTQWLQRGVTGIICAVVGWASGPAIAWTTPAPITPAPIDMRTIERGTETAEMLSEETLALDFRNSGTSSNTVGGASRLFPDFRGTGRPGNHGSGASRGECPLALLVPEEANYGGYTTVANPTLWANVSCRLDADSPITFSLLDGNGNLVYETFQVIDHEPGILKLELPPSVSLEVGQVYKWYFMIHHNDPAGETVDSWSSGWIERIANPVTTDLEILSLVEQSNVYASQLIWYDALDILAEGLLAAPNDPEIIEAWTNLLSLPSAKLDDYSTQPLRDCCTLTDRQN